MTAPEPGQTAIGAMLREMDAKATKGPWGKSAYDVPSDGHFNRDNGTLVAPPDSNKEEDALLEGESGYGNFKRAEDRDTAVTLRNALPALAAYCDAADALHDAACCQIVGIGTLGHYRTMRTALAAALAKEA